jgi:hypothetical protein
LGAGRLWACALALPKPNALALPIGMVLKSCHAPHPKRHFN